MVKYSKFSKKKRSQAERPYYYAKARNYEIIAGHDLDLVKQKAKEYSKKTGKAATIYKALGMYHK